MKEEIAIQSIDVREFPDDDKIFHKQLFLVEYLVDTDHETVDSELFMKDRYIDYIEELGLSVSLLYSHKDIRTGFAIFWAASTDPDHLQTFIDEIR